MIGSPSLSTPRFTSTVATAPRPFSMLDSITTPAARPAAGRLQFEHVGLQQNGVEQFVDALAGLRRHVDEHRIAAPLFRQHAVLLQVGLDPLRIGVALVDLVDCNHDGHFGRTRVLNCFDRLRHDAVVGGNHQHDDVGHLRTAGTHGRERRVTRRVEERDHALRRLDVIGADVLRNTARFARRHLGATDVVEQRGLAVIDVTHDGDHRRTRLEFMRGIGRLQLVFDRALLMQHGRVAEFFDHEHRGVLVDRLVDGGHHAHVHHDLDDFVGLHRHALRQFGDRDGLTDQHIALDRSSRTLEAVRARDVDLRRTTRT